MWFDGKFRKSSVTTPIAHSIHYSHNSYVQPTVVFLKVETVQCEIEYI